MHIFLVLLADGTAVVTESTDKADAYRMAVAHFERFSTKANRKPISAGIYKVAPRTGDRFMDAYNRANEVATMVQQGLIPACEVEGFLAHLASKVSV